MKISFRTFTCIAILCSGMYAQAEFEPPTEGELDQLLANPQLINITIKGANGQEAAGVVIRIIDRLIKAELNPSQLNYLTALYAARTAFLLPAGEAEAYATELVAKAPTELIPVIMAALSIGAGGVADFADHLEELAGEDAVLLSAIKNPSIPLTPPVYNLLLSALGTTQALPPAIIDSLPPPIPVGENQGTAPAAPAAPAPPPVAEGYAGQTGG